MKDYLTYENARNKANKKLYCDILIAAYPCEQSLLMAHHLCIQLPEMEDADEIPAADTLIFDHEIMSRAFGSLPRAVEVMQACAAVPVEERDQLLGELFYGSRDTTPEPESEKTWTRSTFP